MILKYCQSQLQSHNSSMTQTVKENKEILKSNNVSDVNNYKSKYIEFRVIPQVPHFKSPSLKTNTVQGRELNLEFRDYKATLTQAQLSIPSLTDEILSLPVKELLKEAKVIANVKTGVKELLSVACVGSDKVWINGTDKMIQCFDIHGSVQDTVTSTCPLSPNGIAVNRQGELIYSNGPSRTVNVVRHGETETLITTSRDWHPMGLCCTRSGDILVSMSTTDRSHHKIVRYQGQNVTQEIDNDEHWKPIYQGGGYLVYVTENNNGDIVASDQNAKRVVVVNRTGTVRFRYNDKPPGGEKSFSPGQIVTDSMRHIIVADYHNACLHILDQNGQFIKGIDKCGLNDGPHGLIVDCDGRLWVGLCKSGEIKVIQYME
ncbi:uncharacterized protein LOC125656594 [Ostrea edulis]|uniref:uncharacterized protein LOC125656594 n=1 Tax=Ostrea edulis TaxID=37623 RepID=UPI0024AFB1C2|nr:uncharacterized protein LOC125656594 [Ostrea edulis]